MKNRIIFEIKKRNDGKKCSHIVKIKITALLKNSYQKFGTFDPQLYGDQNVAQ